MLYRCDANKSCEKYKAYREKGIKVCEEWKGEDGFFNFYNWSMKNGYSDNLTIDRIDGNKGYNPQNCRWVDYKTQNNNLSRNRLIEYNGQTKTMSEWADYLEIPYARLNSRINSYKMSIEDAFRKEKMNNQTRKDESKKDNSFSVGKYLHELAEKGDLSEATIRRRLKKGMSIDDAVRTKKMQKLSQSDFEEMFKDYYSGMSEKDICKKYSISSATICRYRKRYDMPKRDPKFSYRNRKNNFGY